MRPVKFRYVYKDLDGGIVIFHFTLEKIEAGSVWETLDCCGSHSYKLLGVDQSTGLFDKNGKKIYEGDIVANLFYEGGKSLVIERENEYGGFNISYFLQECVINKDTREVVGNIYENPELLSQK